VHFNYLGNSTTQQYALCEDFQTNNSPTWLCWTFTKPKGATQQQQERFAEQQYLI